MENKIIVLLLAGLLVTVSGYAEINSQVRQTTTGDQSPVVKTEGNVAITYEFSEEKHRKILQEELKEALRHVRMPDLAAKERRLWEQKVKILEKKLADSRKSYEEKKQLLQETYEELKLVKGKLPKEQFVKAEKNILKGDTEAAEQVFDTVAAESGKIAAMASYRSGRLAEDRLDYAKAMRQYTKAVTLEEDNPDYLLAAGNMARTMGDYSQALEWLEKVVAIIKSGKDEDICRTCVFNDLEILHIDIVKWYSLHGQYDEGKLLLKRMRKIRKKQLGKNVGNFLRELKNFFLQKYIGEHPFYLILLFFLIFNRMTKPSSSKRSSENDS